MRFVKTGGGPLKKNNIHTSKELRYNGNYIMAEPSSLLKLRFFYKFICSPNNTGSYTYVTQNQISAITNIRRPHSWVVTLISSFAENYFLYK